jgi:hypothetical protein
MNSIMVHTQAWTYNPENFLQHVTEYAKSARRRIELNCSLAADRINPQEENPKSRTSPHTRLAYPSPASGIDPISSLIS